MKSTIDPAPRTSKSADSLNTLERARAEEGLQQAMLLGDLAHAGLRRLWRAFDAVGAAARRHRRG